MTVTEAVHHVLLLIVKLVVLQLTKLAHYRVVKLVIWENVNERIKPVMPQGHKEKNSRMPNQYFILHF